MASPSRYHKHRPTCAIQDAPTPLLTTGRVPIAPGRPLHAAALFGELQVHARPTSTLRASRTEPAIRGPPHMSFRRHGLTTPPSSPSIIGRRTTSIRLGTR